MVLNKPKDRYFKMPQHYLYKSLLYFHNTNLNVNNNLNENMNPNELEAGDYIEIFFPQNGESQLAEVITIDKNTMKAELLIQNEKKCITINNTDQWKFIRPHQIFYQDLIAFGFNDISFEIAYGWTPKEWTRISFDRKYIFNLSYVESSWQLEILWLDGMMHRSRLIEDINYLHELQHTLKQYNF